mgnify:CR=1 FL=1
MAGVAHPFRSLRGFNYRVWASGAIVSNVGTWMQRVAQDWLVLTVLTQNNATAVGIVTALQFGPPLQPTEFAITETLLSQFRQAGLDDGTAALEPVGSLAQPTLVSTITEGDYVIRSVATGKCIDISSSSTADGAKVQEWDCNGTSAQKFHISPASPGYFKIINVNSGKGLDIKDVSTLANAVVQQWSYGGGANQQFRFVARGANQFSFHPRLTDMAVDLYYGRPDNGTILVQYPYAGTSNQLWTFDSVGGGPTPPPGTVPVVVQNSCPFNLNVVLTGVGEISLEKDTAGNKVFRNLSPGATYTYYPPRDYPSGRVAAYKTLPTPAAPRELEKAEFTLGLDGGGGQNIYYNLTYVDHLGLPMRIAASGGGSGCQLVQCNKS